MIRFTLTTAREASIATEFGDGTAFEVGDTVRHDPRAGRYYALPEAGDFSVVYWVGGSQRGNWVRVASQPNQKAAVAMVVSIERSGRPAMWFAPGRLDAVGMPDGAPFWWDFAALRPKSATVDRAAAAAHARALRS